MVVSARVGTAGTLAPLRRDSLRADQFKVLIERFPVSLGVVAGLLVAVTAMFVLSMPVYHSPIDSTLLGRHAQPRYSLSEVRSVFANHGVALDTTDGLYAVLAGSRGKHKHTKGYEWRVRNVVVHYDGGDVDALAHVQAAVAALRR
jgi:hypothetical protein